MNNILSSARLLTTIPISFHRYTYYALEFLEKVEANSKKTIGEFVSVLNTLNIIQILY